VLGSWQADLAPMLHVGLNVWLSCHGQQVMYLLFFTGDFLCDLYRSDSSNWCEILTVIY